MIKTKDLFKNLSGIFSKKTDPSSVTSISMFDSKISKINLILNSSENVQGSIISEPAIPAAKTEPPVHAEPEAPVHTGSKPSVHHRFKPPVSLNTEPLIHTKPEPSVHTRPKLPITGRDTTVSLKTKPPITPKPEHHIHTRREPPISPNTEPLVQNSTDPYKKGIQDINKLKLQLEQMEISRKSSSNKYKIINYSSY
ncbi:MAG: hypothetical protein KAS90_04240 [Candidatus Aenigmarchaeota archaeon]|nr:hypothetical protein [Candidatus Aenigmarchaeota archaeon]